MYDYKALLIKIADCAHEKICSTPEQALLFLQNCNIIVTESSAKHLKRIFSSNNYTRIRQDGEADHEFSDSGNGPKILIYNYTGNYSKRDFSPENIQNICSKVEKKYKKIEEDFKINMQLNLIDGGFHWKGSDQRQQFFAIHHFTIRPCYYGNLLELETALDALALKSMKKPIKLI